jgi:hypothetical protein
MDGEGREAKQIATGGREWELLKLLKHGFPWSKLTTSSENGFGLWQNEIESEEGEIWTQEKLLARAKNDGTQVQILPPKVGTCQCELQVAIALLERFLSHAETRTLKQNNTGW